MYVIGIDLGGTFVKMGLMQNDEYITSSEIPVEDNQSWKSVIHLVEKGIENLMSEIGIAKIDGIGLAFPGQVDSINMKVLQTTKYLDASEFDFTGWAEKNWGASLVLENDARLACIGEWIYGAGNGVENMVMVTLGTGIGSGVILDNKVIHGKNFRAGNLGGHTIVDYKGNVCQCGNTGCAEAIASQWSLEKLLQSDPGFQAAGYTRDEMNFSRLFDDYRKGVGIAIRTISFCLDIWSAAITNLVHDFDPELVVIGGGILKSSDIILPEIKKRVLNRSWSTADELSFTEAKLGNHATFWGTLHLLRNK